MADDAVRVEPVWAVRLPAYRENNRENLQLGALFARNCPLRLQEIVQFPAQLPIRTNREPIRSKQGVAIEDQGAVRARNGFPDSAFRRRSLALGIGTD